MSKKEYNPEEYWSGVGELIGDRSSGGEIIAGDDEPFYRYKRNEFLKLLNEVDMKNRRVLEVGFGPGGNLLEISNKGNTSFLAGVDISQTMVDLAKAKLPNHIELHKINGVVLPFADSSFDIVFSATVLQHNTNDGMLRSLMAEMARVSKKQVIIFERIEDTIKGDDLCLGRPIDYYASIMNGHKFSFVTSKFINIGLSYYVCGAARKLLNPKHRTEGQSLTKASIFVQKVTLPITKVLDKIFLSKRDLARVVFEK